MKRILFFSVLISLLSLVSVDAQVGKFLKNVKNTVTQDLLGKPDNNKNMPEPPCACDPALLIIDLSKYRIDYTESNISTLSDGRVLVQDRISGSYYVVKDGVVEGPIKESDPRVRQFEQIVEKDDYKKAMEVMYKEYISKKDGKYIISFGGKTYGPYGQINSFVVTKSKNKFAAAVVENIVITEDEGEKMDEAMKNAKSDQERIELAMKYGQQVSDKIMSGGGPESMQPKFVSNVPVNNSDVLGTVNSFFNATMKYDDIVLILTDKVTDLQGKTIMKLQMGQYDPDNTFISSDNSKYAMYSYGTLTISDGKKLSELFNPHLNKTDGKIYLAYMYYSPKKNAIMECKIPF